MSRQATLATALASMITVWAFTACGDTNDPNDPDPGAVMVALTSPNSNDGGMRFTVRGGPIDSITGGVNDVFHSAIDGGAERVIVIGTLAPGSIAQLWLPDRNEIDNYELTVEEVAARGTFASRPLTGYTLTLIRP